MNAALHLVESARLPYLLSLPDTARPVSGCWPVLCFLHGYDEGAPAEIRDALTRHGPLWPGSSSMAAQFMVVAPQLPVRGDVWSRYGSDVHDIVQQVQALHDGDPERTFLTGFSFGGNGVFDLARMQLQFWAALWAVDPTRAPRAAPAVPVWLSTGEASRRLTRTFLRRLQLTDVRESVPGDRVHGDDGEDHVGTATRAYQDDRIYHWLLARRLRRS